MVKRKRLTKALRSVYAVRVRMRLVVPKDLPPGTYKARVTSIKFVNGYWQVSTGVLDGQSQSA